MGFFGQKHGLTPLKKNAIFWTSKIIFVIVKKSFFFFFKVIKLFFSLILGENGTF